MRKHILYVVPLPSLFPSPLVEFSHQVARCAFHRSPFPSVVSGSHHSAEGDQKNYKRIFLEMKGNKQQTNITRNIENIKQSVMGHRPTKFWILFS